IYQRAKTIFRRTAAPSRLIGRSQERERMVQFWTNHVLSNKPGCLYVSGSPGTGKTAMLTEIIRSFQSTMEELDTHQVKEVMINCMSIREPKGIYSKLVNELKTPKQTIQTDIVKQAEQILNGKENKTNERKNIISVVILDEIDHLITRDQDVLYKIFEWASSPASRLVLIGIANALDLTDRLLPRLRTKNCEPQLLNFNPYKVPEISAIIKDRLYSLEEEQDTSALKETRPLPLMQPNAVELCARKVAASMGDLRTALDVCRRAIELAETDYKRKNQQLQQQQKPVLGEQKNAVQQQQQIKNPEIVKVSIPHVMKVLQSVFGSPAVQKLKQLNLQQKIVMGVLMVMARNSKKEQITLGKFRESYTTLCAKSSMITPVSGTELVDLLSNIETAGILTIGKSKEDRSRRIHLSVQDSEIVQMIQEVSVLNSWMSNIVSSQAK
ncbi:P-loop containing nucleoside triphosphate hydrolase protein, partial [Circinella umbellata]